MVYQACLLSSILLASDLTICISQFLSNQLININFFYVHIKTFYLLNYNCLCYRNSINSYIIIDLYS